MEEEQVLRDVARPTEQKIHPIKEVTFGAISGMVGKLIEFPLDTIKVRLQSNHGQSPITTIQMIRQTYHNEGFVHGFYKGLKAPLLGACLETAILFSSYNYASTFIANRIDKSNGTNSRKIVSVDDIPFWSKCVSGGFAGLMASFILTPVELVKCQLQVVNMHNSTPLTILSQLLPQVQKSSSSSTTSTTTTATTTTSTSTSTTHSYSSIVKRTIKDNGITGLWKGLESTIIREVVGTAIWFGTFEYLNNHFKSTADPWIENQDLQLLFSGAVAGVTFNLSVFPVDTIKSNIQTHDILNKAEHKQSNTNFWKEARKLVLRKGGIINLYNGLGITLVRCVPANALIFYTYELLKRNF
ncbi:conserved hypothetical protein [Lodderomyces elongisporus NRRL YB-4239]|uniref:Mitochondrial thiamine pyrophosphate carrier 1 n=1 Tax=Lodderomyces elongisporus (strain ATCC 11503 / CBS 2605 / JCM 1781 / NBRC 1676 / NRRL YB-4239) TaxID=379508 RepID=A5DZA1_LODEL|nr:conserved hypothetical protein [Lodderomyces elongisporus NRRL YB-4239]